MALSRAGRGFNLKTRQRRTLYLYPFSNGDRSPEPWVVVAPPDLNRVKECDFYQTLLNRMWKVPRRDVNKYEHSLEGQKCPIRTIYTPSER